MGYRSNGIKTSGLPIDYVKRFVDEYGIKVFIETGTAGGDSVQAASKIFEVCHSIEIVKERVINDEGLFKFYIPENVTIHFDNSATGLNEVAEPHKGQRICFWLDAHWSENYESTNKENECPLLAEIQAIKGHDALILIDDARLFLGPHPWPCDYRYWPSFQDVFIRLHDCFPSHKITVIDDYIIAVPDYMDDVFRVEWWERFNVRYPDKQKLRESANLILDHFKELL